jgi:hypothetical protein
MWNVNIDTVRKSYGLSLGKKKLDESKEDFATASSDSLDFQNIPVTMFTYHDINQLLDHNRIVITVLVPFGIIDV